MGKVRKQWTDEQLDSALRAVRAGQSVNSVSKLYGIPKTTLLYKFTGKLPIGKNVGPATLLTGSEEAVIVQLIVYLSKRGFPVTKSEIINSVANFVKKYNRESVFANERPGRHWYEGFLRRHPEAARCVIRLWNPSRASVTQDALQTWFENIAEQLEEKGLTEISGSRVFNLDKASFDLRLDEEQLTVKIEDASDLSQTKEKQSLTVSLVANAEGTLVPPMVIFKYEKIPYNITQSVPDSWIIGKSDNGTVTGDLLFEYVRQVFHPYLTRSDIERPVVLYFDGYSIPVTFDTVEFCLENQIELISLYPNSTHVLQPLEISLLRPLNAVWNKQLEEYYAKEHTSMRKEDFCYLFKSSIESLDLASIMSSGFQQTGLHPFNPQILESNELFCKGKKKEQSKVTKSEN